MNEKFILTDETKMLCGHTLHRIKALKDFGGVKAGDLVREIAKLAGGGGGGRPDSAMAGAKDLSKLDDAIAAVEQTVKSMIK